MSFCLIEKFTNKVKEAIRDGSLSIEKLNSIKDSATRRKFLEDFVGKENAKDVNLLYERKLLLKNQKLAMDNFIGDISGLSKEVKESIKAKTAKTLAEKKEKIFNPRDRQSFLNEVASDIYKRKYGYEFTLEEAQAITKLSNKLSEAKSKMVSDTKFSSETAKTQAGAAEVALENYVAHIKKNIRKRPMVNIAKEKGLAAKTEAAIENASISIKFIGDASRAMVAGIADNSFWGNQGSSVLFNPKYTKIWAKNFMKSWVDIKDILKKGVPEGNKIKDAFYVDYFTRENRLNGRYEGKVANGKRGDKLDIGVIEEEIPTDIFSRMNEMKVVSKIPILKQALEIGARSAKAAEVAYEIGASRLRIDIADYQYKLSEKAGIDMTNNFEVGGVNKVINSMTGRGSLGKFEGASGKINAVAFSAKFVKSIVDFLTAHWFDSNMSIKNKVQASKNLITVGATMAIPIVIASIFDKNSTDLDPRSTRFGEIYGNDVTGGKASYLTLLSRIVTQSSKSGTTGIVSDLGTEYGQTSGLNVFERFIENKTSPLASVLKDVIRQETFENEKPTIANETMLLIRPMGIKTSFDIAKEEDVDILSKFMSIAISISGFNKSFYNYETNWSNSDIDRLNQFREQVGKEKFKEANNRFNKEYAKFLDNMESNPEYTDEYREYLLLSGDDKRKVLSKKRNEIKDDILNSYDWYYEKQEKTYLPKF